MNEDASEQEGATLFARFRLIDQAFRNGDMEALRTALGEPLMFPDCPLPVELGMGENVLQYAINWSPPDFVRALIEAGADVNFNPADGFPALIAAISCERDDKHAIVELLLSKGADVNRQGYNDWTPLHLAVNIRDLESVEMLVGHGADMTIRTNIDEKSTALEDAVQLEFPEAAEIIRAAMPEGGA